MSALRDIQTIPWIHRYRTKIFFETGTGLGTGLMRMTQPEYGFELLLSCDIDADLAAHTKKSFSNDCRVNVFNEEGPALLRRILPQLPLQIPIFYWLDSHFANSDYNLGDKPLIKHADSGDPDVRLPAMIELKLIKELRIDRGAKDFILLDDLMLYDEDEIYEDSVERLGPGAVPPEYRQIKKRVIEMYKDTHKPQVINLAQGFLALHPL